ILKARRFMVDLGQRSGGTHELRSHGLTPTSITGVLPGQRPQWRKSVELLHDQKTRAEHLGVRTDTQQTRVRHSASRQRLEHPSLSQDRLVAVSAQMRRWPPQHKLRLATGQQKQIVL